MSSGLGRFNDRKTKQRFLQKQADVKNEAQGFMDPNYYESFDNFDPIPAAKKKGVTLDYSDLVDKLPFEQPGLIEPPYGPLNVGLTKSHTTPSNTHARFHEMDEFYRSQKNRTGEDSYAAKMAKESKENDKKMKQEIHRDHIAEMFGGASFSKEPIKSEFAENFGNTVSPSVYKRHGA